MKRKSFLQSILAIAAVVVSNPAKLFADIKKSKFIVGDSSVMQKNFDSVTVDEPTQGEDSKWHDAAWTRILKEYRNAKDRYFLTGDRSELESWTKKYQP